MKFRIKLSCSEEIEKHHWQSFSNILTSRFVIAFKQVGSSIKKAKSRLVAKRHTDIVKPYIVFDRLWMKLLSLKFIMTFACKNGFLLCSQDVNIAFIQSDTPLQPEIYVVPPRQSGCDPDMFWKHLKLLHRVYGPGDYWYETLWKHLISNFSMSSIPPEKSLHHINNNEKYCALGTSIDEIIIGYKKWILSATADGFWKEVWHERENFLILWLWC